MICINCYHSTTAVSNSRPHKTTPSVWRRRCCPACKAVFTTIERPDLRYSKIALGNDKSDFNIGKLIISIAAAFQHDSPKGVEYASAIADTVMTKLALHPIITQKLIAQETHVVLERFDAKAAMAYALQHRL